MTIRSIAFVILFATSVVYSVNIKEDLNSDAKPTADDGSDQTIDEIIVNAAMTGRLQQVLDLADKPDNIELYMMDSDQMEGMVRVGDMIYTAEQWENMDYLDDNAKGTKNRKKRKAVKGNNYRWPNNIVPYNIAPGHFTRKEESIIYGAFAEWARETCLVFRVATPSTKAKILIKNGLGCSSIVGRGGFLQPLTLAKGCRWHGTVVHEMGHAIGFDHEQTRPDRDHFISVQMHNIVPKMRYNFSRYSWKYMVSHGVPYDYRSIMHYGPYSFSSNGQKTIIVKDQRYKDVIGKAKGLSFRDAKLANLIYKCAEVRKCPKIRCPGEGFVDKFCRCRCPSTSGNPTQSCKTLPGSVRPTQPHRVTTPRPIRTVKPTGICQDATTDCVSWSQSNGCYRHYSLMSKHCRKRCGLCNRKTCIDKNKYCTGWKGRGLCTHYKYKRYMTLNCPRTCKTCASSNIITVQGGKCEDKSEFCEWWSTRGDCEKKTVFMRDNCADTCSFC